MTVCIGVLCENKNKIVLVSDTKVSFGDFSADMAVAKIETICDRWISLFAGNDVEHIPFVLDRARSLLAITHEQTKTPPTPAQVAGAVQEAYEERLEAQIEAKVLRRYKFTCQSFLDEGKKKCTLQQYNNLCSKIADVKLSLRFLLAGFDANNKGHLIVGGGEEAPQHYNALGFAAIGKGRNAAMSSLLFNKERQRLNDNCPEAQALYVAYEAKFMAESATDVGEKATHGFIIDPLTMRSVLEYWKVKEIWKKEGAPRLPDDLEPRISQLILTAEQTAGRAKEIVAEAERRGYRKEKGLP